MSLTFSSGGALGMTDLVVEYQRQTCRCCCCGQETQTAWPTHVIPGQDLDAGLQALLGWHDTPYNVL